MVYLLECWTRKWEARVKIPTRPCQLMENLGPNSLVHLPHSVVVRVRRGGKYHISCPEFLRGMADDSDSIFADSTKLEEPN